MTLRDKANRTGAVWFRAPFGRTLRFVCCAAMLALAGGAAVAADEEEAQFDIHEFSLWGFDPTLEQANQLQHYPTTLPGVVDIERSRAAAEGKVAPFSFIAFHGEPVKNLEVDLRVQSGRFVAHWPVGESKSGRLRWLDLAASQEADKDGRLAAVDARHWFNAARELDSLFLRLGSRNERFLIYDAEFKLDQPLQVAGGPDRYQLTNLGKTPLYDLIIVAPEGDKLRIGRLAELPPSKSKAASQPNGANQPAGAKPAEPKPPETKPTEAKPQDAKPAGAQPAAEAKATESAPEKSKAPEAAETKVVAANAEPQAAATQSPPAAKTAPAPQSRAQAAAAAEPVEIEMSALLAHDAEELTAAKQALAAALRRQGLADKEVELIMDRSAPAIFGTKELLVVCRLPADAIEERLPLVTYPAARKTIRVALVCSRNIDPKIKDEVQQLVARLAATDYADREAAEKRLLELGRLAVPALKEALKASDPEVQFRAERLLLAQNEKIEG